MRAMHAHRSTRNRLFVGMLLIGVLLLARAPIATPHVSPAAANSGGVQPNIILILADDLDLRLDSLAVMPHLNQELVDQGVTFENFFVPVSLCCPSRVSILRGQYTHNHQVYSNTPPTGGFEMFQSLGLEQQTVATTLQDANYRTVLLGKYLNGYPAPNNATYVPAGWSEWYSPIADNAYGGYNYTLNENGVTVPYSGPNQYITDVLAAKATNFITRTAAIQQPFFMFLAPYAPHGPATPAVRHSQLFPSAAAPRSPAFNESDVSDKPAYISNLAPLDASDIAAIDTLYRKRLQSLQAIDESIALLVQTLAQTGQLANTYIIFTSDNGFHMGQHRLKTGKYTPYEEDIHVPFIIRGPNVAAGITRSDLALNIDLAPTFAELAGIVAPSGVDGRSLVGLLSNPPATLERTAISFEQYPFLGQRQPTSLAGRAGVLEPPDFGERAEPAADYRGLRTATYKYVEYSTGEREFYDLVRDTHELNNRAATLSPPLLQALSAWLAEFGSCAGATCRTADSRTPPPFINSYLPSIVAEGGALATRSAPPAARPARPQARPPAR